MLKTTLYVLGGLGLLGGGSAAAYYVGKRHGGATHEEAMKQLEEAFKSLPSSAQEQFRAALDKVRGVVTPKASEKGTEAPKA